jgi:hypothetical protein
VPIWGGDLAQFAEIVRKLSVTETQAVIGFFLRSTPYLETLDMRTSGGLTRVLGIDDIRGV